MKEEACWCWIGGMSVFQGWEDCKGVVELYDVVLWAGESDLGGGLGMGVFSAGLGYVV